MPNLNEIEIADLRHTINQMDREIRQLRAQVSEMEPVCEAYQALTKVIGMIPSNHSVVMSTDILHEAGKLSAMLERKMPQPDRAGETSGTSI